MTNSRHLIHTSTKTSILTIAALALVLALPGCGQDGSGGSALTAPDLATDNSIQVIDDSNSGGSGGGTSAPVGGYEPAPGASSGITATITGQVIEVTMTIPKKGGVIVAGRHTLRILPNTFSAGKVITLRDLTGVTGRVECEILPAGLVLGKQAQLTSNFADLSPVDNCRMFQVLDAGTPQESWVSVVSAPTSNGIGVFGHIYKLARFAPLTIAQ